MSKLNIYACSGVGDTSANSVAQNIKNAGWYRDETLRKYLGSSKDGGSAEFFLYTFIPEEDLAKYNATIYQKRQGQLKTYNYVREMFVSLNYGTEAELKAIIRQGIETTYGAPVESVLETIRTGKNEGVGIALTASAIAAIVTAVLSAVVAIVTGILEYCKTINVAKYTAPTYQEVQDAAPAATDFRSKTKSGGLLLAALAGVGLFLFGSSKK